MLRNAGLAGGVLLAIVVSMACGSSSGGGASPGGDGGNDDATSSGSGGSSGGSGGSSGGSGGSSGSSSGTAGDSGSEAGPPPFDPSVYQHHRNGTRDGLYIDSVFTQAAAKTTHVTTFMGAISDEVYAQPLYVENGPGGDETFIVVTEGNHATAYDATTGAMIWDEGPSVLGTPAPNNPPGGQIDTTPIGITGTPYIDIASRTIFFDAMTSSGAAPWLHKVYALNLDTGAVRANWPVAVDTALSGFDSGVQNQRGALQLVNGILYVPYGGYNGDGGNYYGAVVGIPVANPQKPTWWHTMATRGGIWGPGALPTDGTSIFPVTGNTSTNGTWGGGEAVIRLTAGPAFSGNAKDYFAPTNWKSLDDTDTDLGGASEVLVDMPGQPHPHLVLAGGKDGNLYILDRDNLGGIGGQLLTAPVANNQVKGAPAVYTTAKGTYLALHIENGSGNNCPGNQNGNMVVLQITQNPIAATTVWCSTQGDLASPMVTTTDGTSNPIVWNSDDHLYGYDGDTGAVIVDGTKTQMSTAIHQWNTPIAAKGRIVIGVNGQLYVFTP